MSSQNSQYFNQIFMNHGLGNIVLHLKLELIIPQVIVLKISRFLTGTAKSFYKLVKLIANLVNK